MDRGVRSLVTAVILVLVGTPSALCLSVSVEGPPQSPIRVKQKAHIRFLVDGVPVPNVHVSLFSDRSMVANLLSADDGELTLPELPPGRYALGSPERFAAQSIGLCVVPCPDLGIETTILVPTTLHGPLQVLDRDALAPNHIDMEIGVPKEPPSENLFSAADQRSVIRVSALSGVVQDKSGAIIPNAMIEVTAKGTGGKKQVVALLFSDRNGMFSGHLPDGDYLAFISAPGFRVRVAPFAVTSTAPATDLHFVLELGSVT